jgi:hypothetical protein
MRPDNEIKGNKIKRFLWDSRYVNPIKRAATMLK